MDGLSIRSPSKRLKSPRERDVLRSSSERWHYDNLMGCSSTQYMLLPSTQDISWMNSLRMPWQLHFFFFLYGSLLCLVGSSLYKSEVQHNVPMSSFAAAGSSSVLLSEKGQLRGEEHRELSAIHLLAPSTPCAGSQATLYTSQVCDVTSAPSKEI